mmetsp:Transcript_121651/g.389212  ORF Transcript_121651/g.389212 Transcript_121651/m.389212 type:complete len:204 (+) Transcript_121651:663-1274(+)
MPCGKIARVSTWARSTKKLLQRRICVHARELQAQAFQHRLHLWKDVLVLERMEERVAQARDAVHVWRLRQGEQLRRPCPPKEFQPKAPDLVVIHRPPLGERAPGEAALQDLASEALQQAPGGAAVERDQHGSARRQRCQKATPGHLGILQVMQHTAALDQVESLDGRPAAQVGVFEPDVRQIKALAALPREVEGRMRDVHRQH